MNVEQRNDKAMDKESQSFAFFFLPFFKDKEVSLLSRYATLVKKKTEYTYQFDKMKVGDVTNKR